ncbi:hypothetical protein [Lysobacter xanthus]
MSRSSITAAVLLIALSGCSAMPQGATTPRGGHAVPVVCSGAGDLDCFRAASEACGSKGYDLFDRAGHPATVADAQFRILEARCRP